MAESTKSSEVKSLDSKSEAELKREAKARLRRLSPLAATQVLEDSLGAKVSGPVAGFLEFLRGRGVVGLAVGFVFGSQVQGLVNKFIAGFVVPLFQLIGGSSLQGATFKLNVNGHSADFLWGDFAYALLNFLVVILVVYVTIKLFKLDKLDKKN